MRTAAHEPHVCLTSGESGGTILPLVSKDTDMVTFVPTADDFLLPAIRPATRPDASQNPVCTGIVDQAAPLSEGE
jgi:hypothetical protein